MNSEDFVIFYNNICKLIRNIEYDKGEMDSLSYQIGQFLGEDALNNQAFSLLDRLYLIDFKRKNKYINKVQRETYDDIMTGIKYDEIEYLVHCLKLGQSLDNVRQQIANVRFSLRELLFQPSSNRVGGLICYQYNSLKAQLGELESLAYEIQDYLYFCYYKECIVGQISTK